MLKDFLLHSRNDLLVSILHLLLDSLKDLKKNVARSLLLKRPFILFRLYLCFHLEYDRKKHSFAIAF